jgi:hypothetical protein
MTDLREELIALARKLEKDGDEHGVGYDLRALASDLAAQPSPSREVVFPVMEILERYPATSLCDHVVMGYTAAQVLAYGDARAASAMSAQPATVPEGWPDTVYTAMRRINPKWDSGNHSAEWVAATALAAVHELLAVAPSPAPVVDQLDEAIAKGTEAWADVRDPAAWLEGVRGGEAQAGADDDCAQDAAVWNLIGLAEGCGAERDSDDDSTWWTLNVHVFYALEKVLRERVSDAMYRACEPKPAEGGAVPSAKTWVAENQVAVSGEWMAGWDACRVEYPRSAPAGSGEAGAWMTPGNEPFYCSTKDEAHEFCAGNECPIPLYAGAPPAASSSALPVPLQALRDFTRHCICAADEGVAYAVPRDWMDAMTAMGIMTKVGRGKWAPTGDAEAVVRLLAGGEGE